MPEGPLGFPRLTELGPFVRGDDSNYVYHFTDEEVINVILQNGFKRGYKDKLKTLRSRNKTGLANKTRKTATFEYIIDYYKPEDVDIPNRYGATFFFNTRTEVLLKGYEGDTVIKVDVSKISCNGGTGDMRSIGGTVFGINEFFREENLNYPEDGRIENEIIEDELAYLEETLEKYWREDASKYIGQEGEHMECWFNCDIPPEAIDSIFTGEFSHEKGAELIEEMGE